MDLSVGSKFLVDFGARHPVQAEILAKDGDKLQVKFRQPARPRTCPNCLHAVLSVNAVTGVVVCKNTGCGHDFGYSRSGKVATMKVSDFQ